MADPKGHILIVDDEVDLTRVLSKRLEAAGFTVKTAEDGQSALAKAREDRPGLIILDVMLPKMNGYEVCAKIKGDQALKAIPVVLFTAKGQTQQQHLAGVMAGADAYISKISEFKVLVDQIKALLPQGAN